MFKTIFHAHPWLITALALSLCISNPSSAQEKVIQLNDLQSTQNTTVYGKLGQPMGTFVTIQGSWIDGSSFRRKATTNEWWMKVTRVNGYALKEALIIDPNRQKHKDDASNKISHGAGFIARGYERASWQGVNVDDNPYKPGQEAWVDAGVGFSLYHSFVLNELYPLQPKQTLQPRPAIKAPYQSKIDSSQMVVTAALLDDLLSGYERREKEAFKKYFIQLAKAQQMHFNKTGTWLPPVMTENMHKNLEVSSNMISIFQKGKRIDYLPSHLLRVRGGLMELHDDGTIVLHFAKKELPQGGLLKLQGHIVKDPEDVQFNDEPEWKGGKE